MASVPVFQHIVEHFPCEVHLNYNCNFPECTEAVLEKAVGLAREFGEALSVPYAAWAQTSDCLLNYGDPMRITALGLKPRKFTRLMFIRWMIYWKCIETINLNYLGEIKKTKFLVKFLDFRTTLRGENKFHGFNNHFYNSKVTMAT